MATVKYPIWLSVCYSMGPVLLPVYRTWRRIRGRKAGQEFRVLLFHDIPEYRMGRFARLVRYLNSHDSLIDPQTVEDLLAGRSALDENAGVQYLLTFDDGFESQARAAREILDPLGIKALFFVCPELMNVPRDSQRQEIAAQMFEGSLRSEHLPEDLFLMSWDGLNELAASGHTIGSHTGTHRRLSTLPASAAAPEIVNSADLIEAHTDKPVQWFAYPFGDIDSIDASSLASISQRYTYCCTGVAGPNGAQTEPLAILRENIDLDLSFAYQLFVLEGGMDFLYRRSADKYRSMISSIPQAQPARIS
jgi:peptidoglycan/xylan/chitin deacetylase (PgdA/CDA1 family)